MSKKTTAQQTAALGNTMGLVFGQVGCLTILIVGLALGAGLLLDNFLGLERRVFTIIFMVSSVPLSLYLVTRTTLRTLARAQQQLEMSEAEEESDI